MPSAHTPSGRRKSIRIQTFIQKKITNKAFQQVWIGSLLEERPIFWNRSQRLETWLSDRWMSRRDISSPCSPVGGEWAILENSCANPIRSKMRQVLAQIMTPAPISLNWPADSYNWTWRWECWARATAKHRPPMPPPLVYLELEKMHLEKDNEWKAYQIAIWSRVGGSILLSVQEEKCITKIRTWCRESTVKPERAITGSSIQR